MRNGLQLLTNKAAILCAGPSLPAHIKRLPTGCALFGVNHHASRLIDCDYVVFNDEHTWGLVKGLKGVKISPFKGRNNLYFPGHGSVLSAILAFRAAKFIGFEHIYIAGADCTDTGFYAEYATNTGMSEPKEHLRRWRLEDFTNTWVMGGPLARFAPVYGG